MIERANAAPAVILITDPSTPLARTAAIIEAVARILGPRRLGVQLRHKDVGPSDLGDVARLLRDMTTRSGSLFVVNAFTEERLSLAVALGADGVHVPCNATSIARAREALGGCAFVSTPAHDDADVALAAASHANAVLVSPIWETPGPGKAAPRGLDAIRRARRVSRPAKPAAAGASVGSERLCVYALGGVDGSRAASCAEAGADGVAVIRALLAASERELTREVELLGAPFPRVRV